MSRLLRPLLVSCALALTPAAVWGQRPEIQQLSVEVSKHLKKVKGGASGKIRVAVSNFWSPGGTTVLGQALAAELAEVLPRTDPRIEIVSGATVDAVRRENGLTEVEMSELFAALWVVKRVGADALVVGGLERHGEVLELMVTSWRVSDNRKLGEENISIAVSSGDLALFQQLIPRAPEEPGPSWRPVPGSTQEPGPVLAGRNGVGIPVCIQCPNPAFTREAVEAGYQGKVRLRLVVTPEGRVANIQVQKGAPFYLVQKAIEAVQQWKLKPAVRPDGKPVAVWVTVEINFRQLEGPTLPR